jgi:4-alpha-glucanotransferase
MKLSPNQPLAGILEPVFAIRTEDDLGIGDTEGVRQMIDWCHDHRLSIFQTLPINELSNDNSPYNAISSLAIEPSTLAISPSHVPDLSAEDFSKIAPPEDVAPLRKGPVHYPGVKALKRKLLEAAFANFQKHHSGKQTEREGQFEAFRQQNCAWLSDYSLFRTLMEENRDLPTWVQWQTPHRSPETAREWLSSQPEKRREQLARKQLFFSYVQWLAFSQWEALKTYGTNKKVYLMGDIPFGVSRFSADVWANRALFDLDWSGGAPPEKVFKVDPFTEKWGQNWGVPNYRWDELRRRNFDWWRTRVGNIQKVFHLYRIDHVLGFFRIYSFPWTPDRNAEFLPLTEPEAAAKTGGRMPGFKAFPDDTPEHKAANQAQGEEILHVVLEASGETSVIAEDLGVVPDYVPTTLQKLGIPGFRIPIFFRDHDGNLADPKHYPRLSLAQPTTHDHPPMAAVWAECWQNIDAGKNAEGNHRELRFLMDFAGLKNEQPPREFTAQFHEGFTRAVLNSNSWLAIFQITDVLGITDRFNTPGSVAESNWSHRIVQTVKQMREDPWVLQRTERYARLAKESGRAS